MATHNLKTETTGKVLRISLNRPEKRNALSQDLVAELTDVLVAARDQDAVRIVVLTGEGKVFSAGADLDALKALQSASTEDNLRDSRLLAELFRTIYAHPKVIIARVNGHAIAGGCGLVAAADFAIAADTARFGFTEVKIGFVPAIVSALLVRKLRGADVQRLLLSGALIEAGEAVKVGLLHRAVPANQLDEAVDRLAAELVTETSPVATAATKELLAKMPDLGFVEGLDYGSRLNASARSSADCIAGVQAFLNKEAPPWQGETD